MGGCRPDHSACANLTRAPWGENGHQGARPSASSALLASALTCVAVAAVFSLCTVLADLGSRRLSAPDLLERFGLDTGPCRISDVPFVLFGEAAAQEPEHARGVPRGAELSEVRPGYWLVVPRTAVASSQDICGGAFRARSTKRFERRALPDAPST